jgi:mono/diheme cytochrome c family protein
MRHTADTTAGPKSQNLHGVMDHRAGALRTLAALMLLTAALPAATAAEITGKRGDKSTPDRIYHSFCSVCHGDKGDGKSRAQNSFVRPPRDFTAPEAKNLTREYMIEVVRDGKAGTAMVGWKTQLNDKEIGDVVDYVRATFMEIGPQPAAAAAHPQITTPGGAGGTPPAQSEAALAKHRAMGFPNEIRGNATAGRKFYLANCATCHGEKGDGQGPRAYFINPKPRNFLEPAARNSFNRPLIFEVVSKGKIGTEMPAWDKVLSPQEIANVSEFVFQEFILQQSVAAAKTGAK